MELEWTGTWLKRIEKREEIGWDWLTELLRRCEHSRANRSVDDASKTSSAFCCALNPKKGIERKQRCFSPPSPAQLPHHHRQTSCAIGECRMKSGCFAAHPASFSRAFALFWLFFIKRPYIKMVHFLILYCIHKFCVSCSLSIFWKNIYIKISINGSEIRNIIQLKMKWR